MGRHARFTVRDGMLIVEPNCGLDYPWDAYSFTVANWSLVEELVAIQFRANLCLLQPRAPP